MLISDIYLWLACSHVSTHKINRILEKISPERLWDSFDEEIKYDPENKTFAALKRTQNVDFIERAKEYLRINNVEYITRADPLFPPLLTEREVDPPFVLFYKGNIDILREPCIAVVGTRKASQYGKYATEKIVKELAEEFVIVSGLATGIDGYAHAAALAANGKTAAVLGSGIFNASPASNIKLMDEIIARGGIVLSEYTPDVHASVYTFPQRNRIISGLCRGTIVVEAAEKSGSLITASCALEQGRDVFAVPGDIDKPRSFGTNGLIKQGAVPITSARDVFDFYGMRCDKKKKSSERQSLELDFNEQRIAELVEKSGEINFDDLVTKSGLSIAELNTALSSLLIYGLIRECNKNVYCMNG